MILGWIVGLGSAALAMESNCGDLQRDAVLSDVPCLTEELIQRSFPELKSAWQEGRIDFGDFESNELYFRARISQGMLKRPARRRYIVDVNPLTFRNFLPALPQPSLAGIRGVLAHELAHLSLFERSKVSQLGRVLSQVLFKKSEHERQMDLRAMELGYAMDLYFYRVWLYSRLSDESPLKKRKDYFTPDEIKEWILHQGRAGES